MSKNFILIELTDPDTEPVDEIANVLSGWVTAFGIRHATHILSAEELAFRFNGNLPTAEERSS